MQADRPALQTGDLLARGLTAACVWQSNEGRLRRSATLPDQPGVYALCRDAEVLYVGLASKSLARRLYGYENPGPSQKTNRRLYEWNGCSISGAEACLPLLDEPSGNEGFRLIDAKFETLESYGPASVRKFVDETDLLDGRTADEW